MNLRSYQFSSLVLLPLAIVGCNALSPQDVDLVGRAASIEFPVSRPALIETFGLRPIKSERLGGGIRGGNMQFSESWVLQNGTVITAYDQEFVGLSAINTVDIDAVLSVLDGSDMAEEPLGMDFVTGEHESRNSFESVVITSSRSKILFDSQRLISQ